MGLQIDIVKKLSGFKLEVNLSMEQEIIGILGASGSGKSMMLNSIAGLVKPDAGRIVFDDLTYFDSSRKINIPPRDRKTGYLFQNYAMFPHMTVEENIAFGLDKLPKAEQKSKVAELLERFHLSEMGKRYPSQISGGQQQRVALARALAVEPRILMLDEPFSALDEHLRTHMMKETLESLRGFQGITLFVTHNMAEAYRMCDRIVVLNGGNVEAFCPKQEIFRHPASLAVAKITGCKNTAEAFRCSGHSVSVPEWGIRLTTGGTVESDTGYIGIRSNNIRLAGDGAQDNCFPVWIADESEAPFRVNLYLKIGAEPLNLSDYHIQWEMSREERAALRTMAQPYRLHIDPQNVFFMAK